MKQYIVGALLGGGLVLLLGQTGSPPASGGAGAMAQRLAQLEAAKTSADSRLTAVETRLAALEKKVTALPAGPVGAATSPAPAASGTTPAPADAASADDDAAAALKKKVLGLTAAAFTEVENMPNLWLSPLEQTGTVDASRKPQALAVGKFRYIGSDDLKNFDLKLQIIYQNKNGKTIGMSTFVVSGALLLKPDFFLTFRQPTPLIEEFVYGDTARVVYLSKTKATTPTN